MGISVPFVFDVWASAYPMFSNIDQNTIQAVVLPLAQSYHRNDGGGPINDPVIQTQALWLAVAHVAQLMFGSTTQEASPLVGRVSNATEGSISVTAEYNDKNPAGAWWEQTTYGAAYWQLIKSYAMGFYHPKVTPLGRAWIYGGVGRRF
jgi:hypothetical protein